LLQTPNIGYMTLTGLLGLVGAFSHDRYLNRFLQGMSFRYLWVRVYAPEVHWYIWS